MGDALALGDFWTDGLMIKRRPLDSWFALLLWAATPF